MPKLYLRPIGDATQYSDGGYYPDGPPWQREGFEWVEGDPPEEATLYVKLTILEELRALFSALPAEQQAALGPLAASVLMFLEQGNQEAAKLVIQGAVVSAELEPLKQQMLEKFA